MRQERVHPVDDLDHKGLHLCIRDARDLGPRNFAERGHHLDVAEVSRTAVRRRSGMSILKAAITHALLDKCKCESARRPAGTCLLSHVITLTPAGWSDPPPAASPKPPPPPRFPVFLSPS